jgi:selenocysteine lyase/cysteine desulfurase
VPASSYGLAVAARNIVLREGQRVVLLADDFPSNVYTWRAYCARHRCELVTVQRAPGQDWTDAVLAVLDERVGLAAVPSVHWTDGAALDLVALGTRLRALDARLVVDASQSLGVMPLDFAAVRPDYLVAVGYKWLLGPNGLAYLYVADANLDGMPLEENWIARERSDDFAALVNYNDAYRGGARRFDVGQRSLLEATPIANAALEQLLAWGVDAMAATLAATTARIAREAADLGLMPTSPGRRAPQLLGLALPQAALERTTALLRANRVYVAVRGSALRIAPHVYNDSADVDRLLEVLRQAVR